MNERPDDSVLVKDRPGSRDDLAPEARGAGEPTPSEPADARLAEPSGGIRNGAPRESALDRLDRLGQVGATPWPDGHRSPNPVPWLLALVTAFNLWYLRGHVRAIHDLNDGSFHAAYVRWAAERVRAGRTPFDGLFTSLGLGFPVFHHYQVLPHVVVGALGALTDPGLLYRWTLFLLLALWPLGLYAASRLLGLTRGAAAGAAVLAPFVVALPGYGYQVGSYAWWGYGMWSQLWGMWLFAFAVALAWRAIDQRRSLALAALVASATITSHTLTGYLLLIVVCAFALVARGRRLTRLLRAAAIVAGALAASGWLLIPAVRDRAWTRNGLPPDTFWLDSYGARQVLQWLVSGELFDAGRLPVLTVLAAVGVLVAVRRIGREPASRAVLALSLVSLVLFFGRPTLGPLVDLLPARDDLYLHRMIVGVHLGGVLLAGIGLAGIGRVLLGALQRANGSIVRKPRATTLAMVAAMAVLLIPAWTQVRRAALDGQQWMSDQRAAEDADGADFAALVERADREGGGRVYAGTSSGWGRDQRVGYVPGAIELLNLDAPGIGFTGRMSALTEPSEARFDDTNASHYELFGVRWALLPDDRPPPPNGRLVEGRGRYRLYLIEGSGLMQVVDTTTAIATDRPGLSTALDGFLQSRMAAEGRYPLLDLDGRGAPPPTLGPDADPTDPGQVEVIYELLRSGIVGGQVVLDRPAAVVLKMSYHPRWEATVDGSEVDTFVVAPGYLAVAVPAGTHAVELRYRAISGWETAAWWAVAAAAILALALIDRSIRRRTRQDPEDGGDQPPVSGGGGAVSVGAGAGAGAIDGVA
jgi:hypothetical protein